MAFPKWYVVLIKESRDEFSESINFSLKTHSFEHKEEVEEFILIQPYINKRIIKVFYGNEAPFEVSQKITLEVKVD